MYPYCSTCKGRLHCGKPSCPVLDRIYRRYPQVVVDGSTVSGATPPEVFVGRYGYPNVGVGPLLPVNEEEDPARLGRPSMWGDLTVEDIVMIRAGMMRSRSPVHVRRPDKFMEASQTIALSAKPVDTEVDIKKLHERRRTDPFYAPMGPTADVIRTEVLSNPSVPRRVDAAVSDTDAPAKVAVLEMTDAGIDVYHSTRLLSVGLLGKSRRRKLVPTRWAITATDDIVGKALIDEIAVNPSIDEVRYYRYKHLGNTFHIILYPGEWRFENLECWLHGALWAGKASVIRDYEDHKGRKTYADNITGAYYASRLAVLEHLVKERRRASVLIYREISDEYWAPLGVWVIREGSRKAMTTKPVIHETVDDAVKSAVFFSENKNWTKRSWILKERRVQKRLTDYVSA
jgi:hypothetical protein